MDDFNAHERIDALVKANEGLVDLIVALGGRLGNVESTLGRILAQCCAPSTDAAVVMEQHLLIMDTEALRTIKTVVSPRPTSEMGRQMRGGLDTIRVSAEQHLDRIIRSRDERAAGVF